VIRESGRDNKWLLFASIFQTFEAITPHEALPLAQHGEYHSINGEQMFGILVYVINSSSTLTPVAPSDSTSSPLFALLMLQKSD
jgi:hypothetical protein